MFLAIRFTSIALMLLMLAPEVRADALDLDEARRLVRVADVAAVERVFAEHQARFNAGEIGAGAFKSAYAAFITTEPRVLELADKWRAELPDSPQGMAAKAATLIHQAIVIRGDGFISETPRNSLNRMRALYAEARPLLMRALDLQPRQIYAARLLITAAPYAGDRAGEERGLAALRAYDEPEGVFLHDLNQLMPQWGGSEAAMRRLCRDEAPKIETISQAECDALVTIKLGSVSDAEFRAAIDTLAAEGDDHWVETRADALMRLGRPREALDLLERNDVWIGWSDASKLGRALSDARIVKRVAERWLVVNPYHPRHLAHLAWALDLEGDVAGSIRAADDAMRYGATIPEVRMARMFVISKDEDRKWGLLEEFEDAIAQTNGNAEVTNMVTGALLRPAPYLTQLRDGSPVPEFQCRRLRMFAQHAAACQGLRQIPYNCHPDAIAQVVTPMLHEARRAGECRDMQTKTWQELVEEWLQ